jgi:hypothetical protein
MRGAPPWHGVIIREAPAAQADNAAAPAAAAAERGSRFRVVHLLRALLDGGG